MRLDTYVHGNPNLYKKKLNVINKIKSMIYRILLIDSYITRRRQKIQDRNRELFTKHLTGKKILEVGCGSGSSLASIRLENRCECYGIDISEEMIESAKTNNPGPIYAIMDSTSLEFEDDKFDYVIFNYVLHHVKDLDRTVEEAQRVGKHIIIYESCTFALQPLKALSRLYWKLTDGGYTYKTLDEWKRFFGWKVVEEIRGGGLVRYGMCIFQKPFDHRKQS